MDLELYSLSPFILNFVISRSTWTWSCQSQRTQWEAWRRSSPTWRSSCSWWLLTRWSNTFLNVNLTRWWCSSAARCTDLSRRSSLFSSKKICMLQCKMNGWFICITTFMINMNLIKSYCAIHILPGTCWAWPSPQGPWSPCPSSTTPTLSSRR